MSNERMAKLGECKEREIQAANRARLTTLNKNKSIAHGATECLSCRAKDYMRDRCSTLFSQLQPVD